MLTKPNYRNLRWQCLVFLDTVRPSTMMDSALLRLIRSGYPDATGIELRRALDYLELRGLLVIEKTDAGWGLRLTYQGIDVVDFNSDCFPGIGRPSEPENQWNTTWSETDRRSCPLRSG